jgi:hypothetical protein
MSKAQGSQLVSPLSPTPWALASGRDNEICDVLGKVCILPSGDTSKLADLVKSIKDTAKSMGICRAHGNSLYGYGGKVLKIWYLKITKVHVFKSI